MKTGFVGLGAMGAPMAMKKVSSTVSTQNSTGSARNSAATPSSIHSTNGAATSKLEHAGSPPLQARMKSRMWPGDRVSSGGGIV